MPTLKVRRIDTSSPQAAKQLAALHNPFADQGNVVAPGSRKLTQAVFGEALPPVRAVEKICTDVKNKGLSSLLYYTEQFDKVRLTPKQIRVHPEELATAYEKADPAYIDSLRRVRDNVLQFQVGLLNKDALLPLSEHYELQLRHRPLRRVGVCIPGGAAAYPSTLLMTVCPAQAAEVKEIAVGGAQAVAALAYGVDGIEPVDMIVGPGNIFVTLAKRFVFGQCAIDCLAGPSEVVVAADESAQPDFVALDMIAQAEHSPGVSVLVTWHADLPDEVERSLNKQLNNLDRGEQARSCLEEYGAFVVVKDRAEGVKVVNSLAPEHLHVQTRDPEAFAEKVDNAGAIFLGPFTPVALGDYAAGPSHVLPTGGTARWASGLNVNDFRRRTSIMNFTRAGLREMADDVVSIATKEGLTAHAASVTARVADKPLQLRPSKKAAAAAAKMKK